MVLVKDFRKQSEKIIFIHSCKIKIKINIGSRNRGLTGISPSRFFVVTKKALIFSKNFDFAPEYNYFKAYLYFFKCINFILEYNIFLIIMPIFHSHCVPFRLRSVRYLNLSGLLRAV